MIIFLHGSDSYRLNQYKNELISRHKSKYPSGMNIFYFDFFDDSNMARLEDVLKSVSFFNEHKLVICNNTFTKKTVADKIYEYVKNLRLITTMDTTLLIKENLSEKELQTKHKDLFKALKDKSGILKSFEPLRGAELSNWVRKEFKVRECSIDNDALNKLLDASGGDSQSLINEIDKLSAYRSRGEVSGGDVDLLVTRTADMNIFDLIDAVGSRNQKKGFELLYRELKTGRDPYYILNMIVYQFRNLLVVKSLQEQGYSRSEIGIQSKLHPFVVSKVVRSPLSLREVIATYNYLLALDNGFKTGKLDLEESLYGLFTCSQCVRLSE